MDRRFKLVAWAALVAATGACAWLLMRAPAASPVAAVTVNAPPAVVEHCRRAADLLYDVHWAAACFKRDDANDCMLPDAQAEKVNAILAVEEARCMSSETQARAGQ